jgi:hypothetical protein
VSPDFITCAVARERAKLLIARATGSAADWIFGLTYNFFIGFVCYLPEKL